MALQITGKVLDFQDEWIDGPNGRFQTFTAKLLTGKAQIDEVRMGRDVPVSDYPKEGEEVTFDVVVGAFARKTGAGYRLTALARVQTPALAKAG